ncbi:MAG: hypothetical protein NTW87_00970 [Planctomycetota bacterium]|nr:hypothetical protein [Planctomycetota bacterium]
MAKLLSLLLSAGLALMLCGCRKAAVEAYSATPVQTALVTGEPAFLFRQVKESKETEQPWYREFQVVMDQKAPEAPGKAEDADAEKDKTGALDALIAERKPAIAQASATLLEEVRNAIQAKRKPSDNWSVVRLSIGRAKRPSETLLQVEVGLTRLYAQRPAIALNDMLMELCVAKLSREAGITYSFPRAHNPVVNWRETNVSARQALETLLRAHNFDYQFMNASYTYTYKLQAFPTRGAFSDAVVHDVLEKGGDTLNKGVSGVKVTLRETPKEPPVVAADKEKDKGKGKAKGKKPATVPSAAPAPPPEKTPAPVPEPEKTPAPVPKKNEK